MTIAWSEDINKDDTSILDFFKKTFSFRKHFGTVLTEEIRIATFYRSVCDTETFNDQTNKPKSSLCICLHSVQSFYPNNIAELLWYG